MKPLMPPIDTPDKLFHDGNPATGAEGTIVPAEHLNNEQASIRDLQSEMIAILTAAAMAPDSTAGQLLAALNKLYAPGNDTLGALASLVGAANKLPYFTGPKGATLTDLTKVGRDIIGQTDIAAVLQYLGLGEGSPIIGSPLPWPHAKMPNELFPSMANMVFLKSNGANFSASQYPMLALAYPALRLPDLRSEFIRGYDDGRGVNPSQALLGWAADEFKTHNHPFRGSGGATGNNTVFGVESGIKAIYTNGINQPDGTVAPAFQDPGGSETRPRSVAFNYIVRAA